VEYYAGGRFNSGGFVAEADLANPGLEPISVYVCTIRNEKHVAEGRTEEEDIELIAVAEVAPVPSALPTEQTR
jgi:hypothetical protein